MRESAGEATTCAVQARSSAAFDLVADSFAEAGLSAMDVDCFCGTYPSVHAPINDWLDESVTEPLIKHLKQYLNLLRMARAWELGEADRAVADELDEDRVGD